MEAETQFDIDDILCSNYTQTRYYVSTYGYGSEKIGLVYASLGNVTGLDGRPSKFEFRFFLTS